MKFSTVFTKMMYVLVTASLILFSLSGGAAQVCDTTVDITEDREQLLVSVTGITRLCLRCINPTTMTPETGTIWDFDEQPRTLRNGDTSDDGQIRALNGIAEITNPQTKIMDGPDPYELECVGATYSHTRVELYTNTFLPPVPSPALVEAIVGNNAVLSCDDNNPSPQMISYEWRNSDGVVINMFRTYQITGVTEEQAGVYTCTFTSRLTGERLSAEITLVAQFAPRVSTLEAATQTILVDDTLDLTCLFEAVPLPTAVFLHDGIVLDDSDPRITVVTTDSTSTLTIRDIRRDESGIYSCRFTNFIDSEEISVSVTVFDTAVIPPVLLTNESSSATFDCVGGTNIQWLINGSPLSNHDESIEVRAEGTRLIFEAVALELNGTVVRCVGENSVQVATGILLVQGPVPPDSLTSDDISVSTLFTRSIIFEGSLRNPVSSCEVTIVIDGSSGFAAICRANDADSTIQFIIVDLFFSWPLRVNITLHNAEMSSVSQVDLSSPFNAVSVTVTSPSPNTVKLTASFSSEYALGFVFALLYANNTGTLNFTKSVYLALDQGQLESTEGGFVQERFTQGNYIIQVYRVGIGGRLVLGETVPSALTSVIVHGIDLSPPFPYPSEPGVQNCTVSAEDTSVVVSCHLNKSLAVGYSVMVQSAAHSVVLSDETIGSPVQISGLSEGLHNVVVWPLKGSGILHTHVAHTEQISVSSQSESSSQVGVTVASSVSVFALLLCATLITVTILVARLVGKRRPKEAAATTTEPVYDLVQGDVQVESNIELNTNKAYGHVKA